MQPRHQSPSYAIPSSLQNLPPRQVSFSGRGLRPVLVDVGSTPCPNYYREQRVESTGQQGSWVKPRGVSGNAPFRARLPPQAERLPPPRGPRKVPFPSTNRSATASWWETGASKGARPSKPALSLAVRTRLVCNTIWGMKACQRRSTTFEGVGIPKGSSFKHHRRHVDVSIAGECVALTRFRPHIVFSQTSRDPPNPHMSSGPKGSKKGLSGGAVGP